MRQVCTVRHRGVILRVVTMLLCLACAAPTLPGVSQLSPPDGLTFTKLAWMPSGGKIAVNKTFDGESDSGADIYLLEVATGKLDLLEESLSGPATVQSWSPDGKEIAYWRRDGIWVVSVDGSDAPRFISSGRLAAWSPMGQQIAIGEENRQTSSIWIVDLETEEKQLVFNRSGGTWGSQLVWSPDGTHLAFAWGENLNIYVLEIAAGDLRQVTHSVSDSDYPTWSPDGQLLAYIARSSTSDSAIVIARADDSCSVELLHIEGFPSGLAWSSDGKSIAYSWGPVYLVDIAIVLGKDFLSTGPMCP